MNIHWYRWIIASIYQKFYFNSDAYLFLYLDGLDRVGYLGGRDILTLEKYGEVRVQGPNFTNLQTGHYTARLTINCLIVSKLANNAYDLQTAMGHISPVFDADFIVYKLGEGDADDQSVLGCLRPDSALRFENYGFNKELGYTSGSVEMDYKIELRS